MKKYPGQISIGRTNCSNREDFIHIELRDKLSGCHVTDIEIPLKEFALAMTGLSAQSCTFEWDSASPVGKRREFKREVVEVPSNDTRKDASKYLAPFEVDGWKGYAGDLGNMHHHVPSKKAGWMGFSVSFTRFVDNV